jgi:Tfp pilus assembly protein FimT
MKKRETGVSILNLIMVLTVVAILGILGMKVVPAYIEFNSVRKIIQAMKRDGDTSRTVAEIRRSYEKRVTIDYVESVKPADLEITKEGGETVITAAYSKKIPIVGNFFACLEFVASTKDPI